MMAQTLLRATPTFPLTTRPGQTYAHAATRVFPVLLGAGAREVQALVDD